MLTGVCSSQSTKTARDLSIPTLPTGYFRVQTQYPLREITIQSLWQAQKDYPLCVLLASALYLPLYRDASKSLRNQAEQVRLALHLSVWKRVIPRIEFIDGTLCFVDDGRANIRIIVPYKYRLQYLHIHHDGGDPGHQGVVKTVRRLQQCCYWPGMYRDASILISHCHRCISRNATPQRAGLLRSTPAEHLLHRMSMDVTGPRPADPDGLKYMFVMVNHFSKLLVVVPLKFCNGRTLAAAYTQRWALEGWTSAESYADSAPELWASAMRTAVLSSGSKYERGPPHHSSSQGFVDRVNRSIQDEISRLLEGSEHHWTSYLPGVVFALRTTVHSSTGETPWMLTHGWTPRISAVSSLFTSISPQSTPSMERYQATLSAHIRAARADASVRLHQYHQSQSRAGNIGRVPFPIPLCSLVYIRIPPNKGSSQALKTFNTGIWKLNAYNSTNNLCRVTTTTPDGVTRQGNVHSQFVRQYFGKKPTVLPPDVPEIPQSYGEKSQSSSPVLQPVPHTGRVKVVGRPRK